MTPAGARLDCFCAFGSVERPIAAGVEASAKQRGGVFAGTGASWFGAAEVGLNIDSV